MTDRFERFTYATVEINKYWHRLAAEEMEKYGLKAPHTVYFSVLAKNHNTGLTAAELTRLSGRDKADVSRMMRLLEKKGLAEKTGSNQNLYNGVFKLTDEGLAIAERVKQKIKNAVTFAGKDLTDQDREAFYNALESVAENLRLLCENGIPE